MTDQQWKEIKALASAVPGGLVTAEAVVDFAKDPASALHAAFEWDDSEAARQFRLTQARQVIRAYVRYEPSVGRTVRAMVSVPSDRATTGGYRPTEDVLKQPHWVDQMVAEVAAKIAALRTSYSYLALLDPLWPRLEAVVQQYISEMQEARKAG